jgi:hypothetical protein
MEDDDEEGDADIFSIQNHHLTESFNGGYANPTMLELEGLDSSYLDPPDLAEPWQEPEEGDNLHLRKSLAHPFASLLRGGGGRANTKGALVSAARCAVLRRSLYTDSIAALLKLPPPPPISLSSSQGSWATHTVSAAMAELEALRGERSDLALMVGRRRQQGRQQQRQETSTQQATQPLFDAKGAPQELQGSVKMVGLESPSRWGRSSAIGFRHSLGATRPFPFTQVSLAGLYSDLLLVGDDGRLYTYDTQIRTPFSAFLSFH